MAAPARLRTASSALPKILVHLGLWLLCAAVAGCAGLPARPAASAAPTYAVSDGAATPLGHTAQAALAADSASAFQLLPLAASAYEVRLELARQAERSIDLQSFVFQGDDTGAFLLGALRDAARRGVRVRLLIDDLHSASAEPLLSDIAAFDHVEVRLINPFVRSRGSSTAKLLTSLDQLARVNQRMHNKLFAADNALAVFGGRNIGDEYFMRAGRGGNFVDLDMLAAGQVVRDLSAAFDRYWNSDHAWPIDAIVAPQGTPEQRRARFAQRLAAVQAPAADLGVPARLARYADAPDDLRAGRLRLTPAPATVFIDPVDKLAGSRIADRAGTVRAGVAEAMRGAQAEVFVISPYFVPGELGMDAMRRLRERGVRLRLLTNSLAATDEPAVHAGYVAYRPAMAEIGVEIHELSPSLARERQRLGRFGSTNGVLHAKVVVIDQQRLFVGSMNLDGRSERYNTEDGVLIDSPEMARDFLAMIDFESSTYLLRVGPGGDLQWVEQDGTGEGERVHAHEPEVGLLRKLMSRLLGALLPQDWL